jgi:WD40 repeat protein
MKRPLLATLTLALLFVPCPADGPLQPGYKVDEPLQILFREYRVTGPHVATPGEGFSLVCTYSTRPVVMVYTREINAPVVRLIKKLDSATSTHQEQRLGSYVVLLCENRDRAKKLKALAEKEKIQHTLLSLVVMDDGRWKQYDAKFGAKAQTTVILATGQRRVKAWFAYAKGDLKDKDIAQILASLPKVLPMAPAEEPKELASLRGHTNDVSSIAITADGKTLVSGSSDKTIKLWDLATGKERATLKQHRGLLDVVALSPDGKTGASGGRDRTTKLWDLETELEQATLEGHTIASRREARPPERN